MDAFIPVMAEGLRPLFDRPFAFFGHSLGGQLAFQLARELRRRGDPLPSQLIVSAARAPHVSNLRRAFYDRSREELLDQLKRLSGTPAEVLASDELMDLMLPAIRADFEMSETIEWAHEDAFDIPLTAFAGDRDQLVERHEIEPWRTQTTNRFTMNVFHGGHFFINDCRDQVIQQIVQALT